MNKRLQKGYLWHTIREQNGVYDVYAGLNHRIELLYFVSYRNPLLTTTLSAYTAVSDALYTDLRERVVTLKVATMVIIGTIASINRSAPPPGTIGFRNMAGWLTGRGGSVDTFLYHEVGEFFALGAAIAAGAGYVVYEAAEG